MRSGRLAAAVWLLLVPTVAAGQDTPRCPGKTISECANSFWTNPEFGSPAWLDTMHTWSVAADWDTAADCSKVK